jgi:hypothetical protein
MEIHVKVLGILYIVLGALGLMGALVILLIFGGAGAIVGAAAVENRDALIALPIIGIAGTALALFLLFLSLPGIIAGVGLLQFRPWARILTLVLSILNLVNVPLGTALGVYGLWVLLSRDTEPLFGISRPVQP